MGSSSVYVRVSFKNSFDIFLLVTLFSKARANLEDIAWCDFDSSSEALSFMAIADNSVGGAGARTGARVRIIWLSWMLN